MLHRNVLYTYVYVCVCSINNYILFYFTQIYLTTLPAVGNLLKCSFFSWPTETRNSSRAGNENLLFYCLSRVLLLLFLDSVLLLFLFSPFHYVCFISFYFLCFYLDALHRFLLPPPVAVHTQHNCQRGSGIFESCPHFYGLSNLHSFYISGPGLPYASNERCLHWGSMAEPRLLSPCLELKAEFKAYSKNLNNLLNILC